jgi:hypothetical protein
MLTKVELINLDTGERRLLKNWFFRYRDRLSSLGTADRREAEKRAYHLGRLLRAIFERQDEPFTDEAPLPQQTVAEEDTPC